MDSLLIHKSRLDNTVMKWKMVNQTMKCADNMDMLDGLVDKMMHIYNE